MFLRHRSKEIGMLQNSSQDMSQVPLITNAETGTTESSVSNMVILEVREMIKQIGRVSTLEQRCKWEKIFDQIWMIIGRSTRRYLEVLRKKGTTCRKIRIVPCDARWPSCTCTKRSSAPPSAATRGKTCFQSCAQVTRIINRSISCNAVTCLLNIRSNMIVEFHSLTLTWTELWNIYGSH